MNETVIDDTYTVKEDIEHAIKVSWDMSNMLQHLESFFESMFAEEHYDMMVKSFAIDGLKKVRHALDGVREDALESAIKKMEGGVA